MSWMSEAHQQWHSIYGAYEPCPLDCGAGDVQDHDPRDYMTEAELAEAERWAAEEAALRTTELPF